MPSRNKKPSISRVRKDHAECRSWGHRWYSRDVQVSGGEYHVEFSCNRCETLRVDTLDAQGYLVRRRYDYAEEYIVPGLVVTAADRASLRLTAMGRG